MIVSSYSLRRRATYLASAIDQLPGPGCNPDLLAVALLEADPRGLARLRILDRDLRNVQRRLGTDDAALRTRLRRLGVTGMDVDAGNQHLAVLRHHPGDLAVAALVLAGQDDDLVALLDLRSGHYRTSGARLMIFICFLARSSRTTGPKIRVPIGSWLLFTSTAAFESKRMVEPSGRWMSLAVRTITALWTSPFFTRPRGAASLTLTTMMSPTPAKRRLEPPSTLMHWTRLAPLLSATSRLDCIWIIDPIPSLHFNRNESGDQLNSFRLPPSRLPKQLRRGPQPEPRSSSPWPASSRPSRAWRACRRGRAPSRSSAWKSARSPRCERSRPRDTHCPRHGHGTS